MGQHPFDPRLNLIALDVRADGVGERSVSLRMVEERVIRHNQFADALKAAGIHYKDREHVTRIAYRIAKEEL